MHGLTQIRQINELAAQNAPGAPEKALEEADKSREGRPTKFDLDYAEAKARHAAERQRAVAKLSQLSNEELISISRAVNSLPSTLEEALANRLEEVCRAFGILNKP